MKKPKPNPAAAHVLACPVCGARPEYQVGRIARTSGFWRCEHGDVILHGDISGPNQDPSGEGWNAMVARLRALEAERRDTANRLYAVAHPEAAPDA